MAVSSTIYNQITKQPRKYYTQPAKRVRLKLSFLSILLPPHIKNYLVRFIDIITDGATYIT